MKKLLLLGGMCLSFGFVKGQTLKSDGTVENSSHSTIGYYKSDGTVEDSHHSTIGYIKKDGTIEDSHHSTVGHAKSDGTCEDSHHSTIGHVQGKRDEYILRLYFFKG